MIGNEPAPERIKGYERAAAVMLTVGEKPANYMAAAKCLAAEEWVASQDWTGKEEPCAVQVALNALKKKNVSKDLVLIEKKNILVE